MKNKILSSLFAFFAASSFAAEKPNFLIIMADDLGWFDTAFNGNETLITPHLDQLAREGMLFTDGYAASPVCTPTRAAMMTGQSPARLAITNHAPGHKDGMVPGGKQFAGAEKLTYLPLEAETIAERLKNEAGYATGFVGKWHLSHRPGKDESTGERYEPALRPEFQGFDLNAGGCDRGGPPSYFEPYRIPALEPRKEGEYLPERMADECIAFLEKHRDGKQPFFLSFWNYSVHYPIEAPADLIEKHKKIGKVENPAYAAMIEGMDRSIGRVLAAVDELGLRENTFVVFKSDNGSLFGNGPLRANKGHLYEGGIRVPWLVRWPGKVEPGSRSDEPVISTDVVPTLMEIAGLPANPGVPLDGESLVPILTQSGDLKRDAIFFHYPNYAFHKRNRLGAAIREGDFKLIRWFEDDALELYNLDRDIGERTNLAQIQPKRAAALREKLDAWLEENGAKMPTAAE